MNRSFRYTNSSQQSLLKRNSRHNFAMSHALRIYPANAIYSFIPKNACSTLRLSLAMANGCIQKATEFNWIHHNNDTFSADLASAHAATYTFVVLRCPYARLASAYLDKIVGHYPDAWQLYDLTQRRREVSAMNFEFFIRQLRQKNIREANIHWRPQVDFLLYNHYDDYFCLEAFAEAPKVLQQKIQLAVIDARPLTRHGIGQFTQLGEPGEYARHSSFQIMCLKQAGQCPSPLSLYTDELAAIVRTHYSDDIALYQSLFGADKLMI